MLGKYFNQHDQLDKASFRFHVNILTWSCYIFQSLWQPSCTPFKAAWLLESPFLWLFASESFVFQKCMYYVPHIRLKNCSITKIWGSTEAVSWLTESQVDQYWNWWISQRERDLMILILIWVQICLYQCNRLIDFHNFWSYHYTL